jgi:acyl carrier protein
VGYAVAPAGVVDGARLRETLEEVLPDYMVPAAVVVLPAWPRTASGKVDRRALPAPEVAASTHAHRVPGTPLEAVVCQVTAEVLGIEAVGLDDNFFALGGHSLLAIRLVTRLQEALAVDLPMPQVFAAKTIEELAAVVCVLKQLETGALPGAAAATGVIEI